MINTVRGEGEPVLLVDCGGSFSSRFSSAAGEMLADKSLQVANAMGYAAMNIGPGEFSFGIDFLRKKSSDITFPLVASNLSYAEGVSPFTKSFVITQAGGLKVAILGVMPPGILEAMPKSGTSGLVEVIPPDKALALILPVVRKEADIVILLSQLGATETKRLAGDLEGIDLFIYGGGDNQPAKCDEDVQASLSTVGSEAPALKTSAKGSHLGYARLSVDDTGRVTVDM
ncbi:MAG: hypothetical protein E4G90_04260 [Gemmatimonadales bacterium]|nr:MAG: hypothetical protein E4G90_04260 [Gemmatimonadales bacterium]